MDLSKGDCAEIRHALSTKATGCSYRQVARWLRHADFEPPRTATGSHRVWYHSASGRRVQLVDKGSGEILPVYVKRAAQAIIDLGGCA
jgi:hypothetical protein